MIHKLQRVEASGQALYAKREAQQPQNVGHIVQGRLHWLAQQRTCAALALSGRRRTLTTRLWGLDRDCKKR